MFLYEAGNESTLPYLKQAEQDPEFEVALQVKMAIDRIENGEEAKGSVWKQMTESRQANDKWFGRTQAKGMRMILSACLLIFKSLPKYFEDINLISIILVKWFLQIFSDEWLHLYVNMLEFLEYTKNYIILNH